MSTFPTIARYTPAVLAAVCKDANITPEQYRINTLKTAHVEIANLIESDGFAPDCELREAFEDLLARIRCALADE